MCQCGALHISDTYPLAPGSLKFDAPPSPENVRGEAQRSPGTIDGQSPYILRFIKCTRMYAQVGYYCCYLKPYAVFTQISDDSTLSFYIVIMWSRHRSKLTHVDDDLIMFLPSKGCSMWIKYFQQQLPFSFFNLISYIEHKRIMCSVLRKWKENINTLLRKKDIFLKMIKYLYSILLKVLWIIHTNSVSMGLSQITIMYHILFTLYWVDDFSIIKLIMWHLYNVLHIDSM